MMLRIAAAFLFATIALSPAAAQAPNSDCVGDDRCTPPGQAQQRALFGAPSIEEHVRAGDEVRRVFYADGYAFETVMIAFVRARGRDPEVRIHFPSSGGGPRPEPLRAPVPKTIWDETVERARHFDRSFAPRADGVTLECSHSAVYVIEAAEPDRFRDHVLGIRRKVENGCDGGPGAMYAADIVRLALALVPHCAILDLERQRDEVAILSECRILHGDRLAAAEALNAAGAFRTMRAGQTSAGLANRFAYEARIDWNGQRFSGEGAATFWLQQIAQPGGESTHLNVRRVEGESGHRVRLTGFLTRFTARVGNEQPRTDHARVEQVWVRDRYGDFKVREVRVGPWIAGQPERAS